MIHHGDPDKIPMTEFAQEFHELVNELIYETEAEFKDLRDAVAFLAGTVTIMRTFLHTTNQIDAFNAWIEKTKEMMPTEEMIRNNIE